ncbi:MAG: FAD-dependent oxidoreductase [Rhodospirillales bacterium]|nr:FAD-dependent oxidoreductase [Rhodospirillales bacterium]
MADIDVPVLIIGGGPVGLVLAMELATGGVDCLLVNERQETSTHPKGSAINCRSMEHLRRLGLAPAVRHVGLPYEHATDSIYVTRLTGYELGRIVMPSTKEKIENPGPWGPTLLTPEPIHRCNQMYFEAVFKQHAEQYAETDIRFGWRLLSFTDYGGHVEAVVEDIGSGEEHTVNCQYLVGCDGANSLVRRQLGVKYGGRSSTGDRFYDGRMMSAYYYAPQVYGVMAMQPAWHHWTVNPDGRGDVITLDGKGHFLLLAEVEPGVPFEQFDARQLFLNAIGADIDVEVISVMEWTAGLALVTDKYQVGRVFMAGDSVHLFTPSGGFGFNTGIDDAANLGWKLVAACAGWGGDRLLETYETERRPIGIRNTSASGDYAAKIGEMEFPAAIEDDGSEGEAARASMRQTVASFTEEFASLGIQLGSRYDGSPLIVGDGTTPPPDDRKTYTPSATPGGRAPHVWLADGGSLFDRFGPGFTLLRLGAEPEDVVNFTEEASKRGIPFTVVDVGEDAVRELYECRLALIRPDQHIAWRGDAVPEDPGGLWDAVTGRT